MGIGSLITIPNDVIEAVCEAFDVDREEVYSKSRTTRIVEARGVIWYVCRQVTMYSYPELGREFGRDHSTIIHGVTKVEARMYNDKEFSKKVATVVAYIQERNRERWQTTSSEKSSMSSRPRQD